MADPDVSALQTARADQAMAEPNDPVTGGVFPTGYPRQAVDLGQAVQLLDWDQ